MMPRPARAIFRVGVICSLVLTAACSGGEPEESQPTQAAAAPPSDVPPLPEAPPADDTTTLAGVTLAEFPGDAAAGEAVFIQCQTCHTTEAGVNRIGPSLAGIVGRHAGTIPDFSYSPANVNSGITWTPEKLFQYLENPQRVVPGTKMTYNGVQDPQQRANLIAWLGTKT